MRTIRQYHLMWSCVQGFEPQVLWNSCLGDDPLDLTRSKLAKRIRSAE